MDKKRGLSNAEAIKLRDKYGVNEIKEGNKLSAFRVLLRQVRGNFVMYLLLAAAILSFFVEKLVTGYALIAIVVATFDIFIQYKRFDADKYDEFTKVLNQRNEQATTNQNSNMQSQIDRMRAEIDNLWKSKYPVR